MISASSINVCIFLSKLLNCHVSRTLRMLMLHASNSVGRSLSNWPSRFCSEPGCNKSFFRRKSKYSGLWICCVLITSSVDQLKACWQHGHHIWLHPSERYTIEEQPGHGLVLVCRKCAVSRSLCLHSWLVAGSSLIWHFLQIATLHIPHRQSSLI